MHFERVNAFQNAYYIFPVKKKKICVFTLLSKIFRPVTRNTLIFYLALAKCLDLKFRPNKRCNDFFRGKDYLCERRDVSLFLTDDVCFSYIYPEHAGYFYELNSS